MITEVMEGNIYKSFDGDRTLCTITSLGNNIYRAVNMECDITAEVEPEDDYITWSYKARNLKVCWRQSSFIYKKI